MNYVFRLKRGMDLKEEITKYVHEKNIKAGVVKCAVGCVYEATFRLAEGKEIFHKKENYEIVSITGTVGAGGFHIHISLADNKGNVVGGHLKEGCIIDTTAEVCIESFDNYVFDRVLDDDTGYKELVVTDNSH